MTHPLDLALEQIAAVFAAEPRPAAHQTAVALRAGGAQLPRLNHAPCALDNEIRACLSASRTPCAIAVLAAMDHIPWGTNPVEANMTSGAAAMIAVATLLDPDGPIPHPGFRMGLAYMRPNAYYPLHNHDADETYALIAGRAFWTAGDDRRWRGPDDMIHHPSLLPHAFRTEAEGFVALWRWSGDINAQSYTFLPDPDDCAPA